MSKTWETKQELLDYILAYYVTGQVTRKQVCAKFNINQYTLNSYMYYHKIKVNKEKEEK